MLVLSFRFLAGRYHATPWGRHVNEADVAWPPEPWRLLRALIAVWHRKADRDRFPEEVLARLMDRLAEMVPHYRLPPALHSHVRHYMPWFKKGPEDKTLVFDGFLQLAKDDPLEVCWPEAELPADERSLVHHLTERMDYLGRAESWVEVTCRFEDAPQANCLPEEAAGQDGTPVSLLVPLTARQWQEAADRLRQDAERLSRAKRSARMAVLGPRLIDALSLDTADWQREGFARPPATRGMAYRRSAPEPPRPAVIVNPRSFTTASFVLAGKPLPTLRNAVRIGEIMRRTLMKVAQDHLGAVPWQISGHGENGNHRHAYFLPEDADGDGYIDHIVVHSEGRFDPSCETVFAHLSRLWGGKLGEWPIALEMLGSRERVADMRATSPIAAATTWESVTPYLHPWHRKSNFGPQEQLRRELERRELPRPLSVERLDDIPVSGQRWRAMHFHRFRSHGRQPQPDTQGSLWRIVFAEPITGPLALGFACHYGLGAFRPVLGAA